MQKLTILFIFLLSISTLFAGVDSLLSLQKFQSEEKKVEYILEVCFKNRSVNVPLALESGHRAYDLAKKINNSHYIARSCNMLSVVYRGLGNFEKALGYGIQAVSVSDNAKDTVQLGFANNNIGHIYRLKGFLDKSLQHTLSSYYFFKSQKHNEGMAFSAINLGYIYIWMSNPKEAIPYFQESSDIRRQMGDLAGEAVSVYGLANAYAGVREFHTALNIYNNLLQRYDTLKFNAINPGHLYSSIGKVYRETKQIDSAIQYFIKAVNETELTGNLSDRFVYAIPVIDILDSLKRFEESDRLIKRLLPLAKDLKDLPTLSSFYKSVQNHYSLTGNIKIAYKYADLRSVINDSITQQVKRESLESMSLVFDNFRIYEENQVLQSTILERPTSSWFELLMVLFLVIAIVLLYFKLRRTAKKRNVVL